MIRLQERETAQETFDFVVSALLKQGTLSTNGAICMYRDPEGHKCAIGVLISDEDYSKSLEGVSLKTLINSDVIEHPAHEALIFALQTAHDGSAIGAGEFTTRFKARAREVAEHAYLSTQAIDAFEIAQAQAQAQAGAQ